MFRYGQWKTILNWNSCDSTSSPIPWYTYPATEYLEHLDLFGYKVHEFGSGNSTLWWANRVHSITSVEDDENWYRLISSKIRGDFTNVHYRFLADKQLYTSDFSNDTDIFIVDGSYRKDCIDAILKKNSFLMIVFDNSDWYPKTIRHIQDIGQLIQIDFHGFGPINNYTWTTSIFLNPKRSHEIRYQKSLRPIACLDQVSEGD